MKINIASNKDILKNSYKDYIKFIQTRLKTNQHLLNGVMADNQKNLIFNQTSFKQYIDEICDKALNEVLNFVIMCLNKNRKTLNSKQAMVALNLQEKTLYNEQIDLLRQYYALKYMKYALYTKSINKNPSLTQEL